MKAAGALTLRRAMPSRTKVSSDSPKELTRFAAIATRGSGRHLQGAEQGLLFLGDPGPIVGRSPADSCLQVPTPAHALLRRSLCIRIALCACRKHMRTNLRALYKDPPAADALCCPRRMRLPCLSLRLM